MVKIKCSNCGNILERLPCRAKRNCYCNNKCQMTYEYSCGKRDRYETTEAAHKAVREKAQERLAKGEFDTYISKRGYVMVYIPLRKNVKLHHYLWEQHHGKPIPKGYHLHHKNFNKLDNRIENLQLLTESDHMKLHYKKRRIDIKTGRFIKE